MLTGALTARATTKIDKCLTNMSEPQFCQGNITVDTRLNNVFFCRTHLFESHRTKGALVHVATFLALLLSPCCSPAVPLL